MTIYSVTLNPVVDCTVLADSLTLGGTAKVTESWLEPGGKGLNVSRALKLLGGETIALGFLGGQPGVLIREALRYEGVPEAFVMTPAPTRVYVYLFERDGRTTKIQQRASPVPAVAVEQVKAQVRGVPRDSLVVFGGSAPPGVSPGIYRELIEELRARGVAVILDSHDAPFLEGIEAKPLLIKPNDEEAGAALGRELKTDEEILAAARELHAGGIPYVVLSMGPRGAIAVSAEGAYRVVSPPIERRSTVGSGDSMVAGMALALSRGDGFPAALRLGTAAGAATAETPGHRLFERARVEELAAAVEIHPL